MTITKRAELRERLALSRNPKWELMRLLRVFPVSLDSITCWCGLQADYAIIPNETAYFLCDEHLRQTVEYYLRWSGEGDC